MPTLKRPTRVLVVIPSWVGDAVMATPALRTLRLGLPGALIGGLCRPGIDGLLAGLPFVDEFHVEQGQGMMGPKRAAAKVRLRRYDAAVVLTNSFSTALSVRLAGIPRRWGYDRDGRGVLLTDRLRAPLRRDVPPYSRSGTAPSDWAPVPACAYYLTLARAFLKAHGIEAPDAGGLELAIDPRDAHAATELLAHAFGAHDPVPQAAPRGPLVLLNPGGNNPAKRWPAAQFADLATWLVREREAGVLVSGSPAEAELTAQVRALTHAGARESVVDVPALTARLKDSGAMPKAATGPLGLLKALVGRCGLMVTNDTGPRHIAAALGVPVVTLFGPTDHRWTTIPFERERLVLADPTLPEEEVANDHPQRCAIERITLERVIEAAAGLLGPAR